MTFLEFVYESQAETLPDYRDDPKAVGLSVEVSHSYDAETAGQYKDAYVDALMVTSNSKKSSKNKHKRSVAINPDKLQLEQRWLPPGHMMDWYEQMVISEGDAAPVSFSCFWRTWLREFPHLRFRAQSNHAMCTSCLRHKLLLRQFAHHLNAREAQKKMYIEHLRAQYEDRTIYYRLRASSRSKSSPEVTLMIDSMDQCKFIYPRSGSIFRSKELGSMIRPKAHITGVLCHGYFFLVSVSAQDMRKDASAMVELLSHCLTKLVDDFAVDLTRASINIQSDNTVRECKNNIMLQWLAKLTSNRVLIGQLLYIVWMFVWFWWSKLWQLCCLSISDNCKKIQENIIDNIVVLGCSGPTGQLSILQFISGFFWNISNFTTCEVIVAQWRFDISLTLASLILTSRRQMIFRYIIYRAEVWWHVWLKANITCLKSTLFLGLVSIVDDQGLTGQTSLRCLRSGHSHEDLDQVFGVLATPGPEGIPGNGTIRLCKPDPKVDGWIFGPSFRDATILCAFGSMPGLVLRLHSWSSVFSFVTVSPSPHGLWSLKPPLRPIFKAEFNVWWNIFKVW